MPHRIDYAGPISEPRTSSVSATVGCWCSGILAVLIACAVCWTAQESRARQNSAENYAAMAFAIAWPIAIVSQGALLAIYLVCMAVLGRRSYASIVGAVIVAAAAVVVGALGWLV